MAKKYDFFPWLGFNPNGCIMDNELKVELENNNITGIGNKVHTPVNSTVMHNRTANTFDMTLSNAKSEIHTTEWVLISHAKVHDISVSDVIAHKYDTQHIAAKTVSFTEQVLMQQNCFVANDKTLMVTASTSIPTEKNDSVSLALKDDHVVSPILIAEAEALKNRQGQDQDTVLPTLTSDITQRVHECCALQRAENSVSSNPRRAGFFKRLKSSLDKTRHNMGYGFIELFRNKKIDDDLFEELEERLLIADVGIKTTRKIIDGLSAHAKRCHIRDSVDLYKQLRVDMEAILANVEQSLKVTNNIPFVILMVGVNGVGKTTTIGKLAWQYQTEGKSVMLAAGDTFRAAAVEQLQVWGERNRVQVVAKQPGAESASVIFDAIKMAKVHSIDVLIVDTAGRLQNKVYLMNELKKINRVMKKLDVKAPHEVMLTLDATTGQNAISQANLFNDAVGLTGIVLTKLDGTAKGGIIFSVAGQLGIPIRYIGIGENIEDLRPFKANDFIKALF